MPGYVPPAMKSTGYNVYKIGIAFNRLVSGTWGTAPNTNQILNLQFDNSLGNLNDEIEYKFFSKRGTFILSILTITKPNGGIATVYIDGIAQGTIDFYADVTNYNTIVTLEISIPSDGDHTLNFKVTGKNASSTGYVITISAFWLRG